MDRKKDRNRTGRNQLEPDRQLRLCTFQIDGPRLRDQLKQVLSVTGRL